ncbi:MAG: HAD family hydrolase, partial [Kamptonema sp. SIO4C4]|nr:HAD family hydrolase [Kamptonema sp. SIO4C4]
YEAAIAFADDKPIRPGLAEFIDFLDSQQIPFHVVSGGLKGMVERVLQRENLLQRVASVTAVEVDTSEEKMIVPPQRFEGDSELVAKVQVIQHYTDGETIAIGDSLTDVNMALYVQHIFARDRLVQYLETANKPYLPWTDFRDIHNTLQHQWQP